MPSCSRRFSSVSDVGELLEQVALLAVQPPRDDDVDDDAQIARAAAPQRRQPAPGHHDRLARLRAGGHVQRDVAVERRHLDRRAQRRQRRGDVDHGHEVLAVADEALVLLDAHDDVQVAGRPAALARVAAAGDPQPLAVVDPGRDVDLHAPLRRRPSRGRRRCGRAARRSGRRRRTCRTARSGPSGRSACAGRPGSGPRRGSGRR